MFRCLFGLLFFSVTSQSFSTTFGDYTYTSTGTEVQITLYDGLGTNIIIPSTIAGLPVTGIGESAFASRTNIQTITIPTSVTNIGHRAFEGCTKISNIVIPDTVTSLGQAVFNNCTNLQTVILSTNLTTISDMLFLNCRSLKTIELPNKITNIGNNSFAHTYNLTNINMGTNIITLGSSSFLYSSSLKNLTLPNSVNDVGAFAFQFSGITNINLGTNVTRIQAYAFQFATNLETISLPNSINEIGTLAFSKCYKLKSVALSPVTVVGSSIFLDCTNLTSVSVPEGTTVIGAHMFRNCKILESVVLPTTITNVLIEAFADCSALKAVYFLGNAPSREANIFWNSPNVTVFYTQGTSGWGSAFSGVPTAITGTYTITSQFDSAKGLIQIDPNQPFYNSGTIITVYAIPNPGFVFDSWSGGPPESISSPLIMSNGIVARTTTLTLNTNKVIGALFLEDLGDNDTDGLSNYSEILLHGSNPNNSDSNGDGISDGRAVALGYGPLFNFSALISSFTTNPPSGLFTEAQYNSNRVAGRNEVINSPNGFGLYTTNQLEDMAVGSILLSKMSNGSAAINLTFEKSSNLSTWETNSSHNIIFTNLPSDKVFLRFKAKR